MRTLVLLAAFTVVGCKKDAPAPEAAKAVAEVKAEPAKPVEVKVEEKVEAKIEKTDKASSRIELKVTEAGFEPGTVNVKKDQPVTLVVTRTTDATCATELLIADTAIKADLPLNKPVEIAWTPTKAGQVKFGCAMDMMVSGMLIVE